MVTKQCTKCKEWKEESRDNFHFYKSRNRFYTECNVCWGLRTSKYRMENLDKEKAYQKRCADQIRIVKKKFAELHPEVIKKRCADFYQHNREKQIELAKIYYLANSDKIKKEKVEYRKRNRDKINKYKKDRYHSDPSFKMRTLVTGLIRRAIVKSGSKKNNASFLRYVDWTLQNLKKHLETQFESWMTWDNHGVFNSEERRWQIDHIIPQSALPYDSMEHPNFKKSWALENLRPLEAKENMRKGKKIL